MRYTFSSLIRQFFKLKILIPNPERPYNVSTSYPGLETLGTRLVIPYFIPDLPKTEQPVSSNLTDT